MIIWHRYRHRLGTLHGDVGLSASTAVVGPQSSGKSTFIRGIRLAMTGKIEALGVRGADEFLFDNQDRTYVELFGLMDGEAARTSWFCENRAGKIYAETHGRTHRHVFMSDRIVPWGHIGVGSGHSLKLSIIRRFGEGSVLHGSAHVQRVIDELTPKASRARPGSVAAYVDLFIYLGRQRWATELRAAMSQKLSAMRDGAIARARARLLEYSPPWAETHLRISNNDAVFVGVKQNGRVRCASMSSVELVGANMAAALAWADPTDPAILLLDTGALWPLDDEQVRSAMIVFDAARRGGLFSQVIIACREDRYLDPGGYRALDLNADYAHTDAFSEPELNEDTFIRGPPSAHPETEVGRPDGWAWPERGSSE